MARVAPLGDDDGTPAQRAALAKIDSLFPPPRLNILATIARAPGALVPIFELAAGLRGELDPKLRELGIVTALHAARARYEFVRHWGAALGVGVPEATLAAVCRGDMAALTPLEQAVVRFARSSTLEVAMPEATWRAVHDQLGDTQTLELLMNVGLYNMTARLTEAVRVEDEPWYTPPAGADEAFLWGQT